MRNRECSTIEEAQLNLTEAKRFFKNCADNSKCASYEFYLLSTIADLLKQVTSTVHIILSFTTEGQNIWYNFPTED